MSNSFDQFFKEDSGAVTVDWVVLTAATVGLGIASLAVVVGGVDDLSSDVSGQLTSQDITTRFAGAFSLINIAAMDFSNGELGGWLGASIRDAGGEMGEVLYIDQQQTASLDIAVPEGATEATMAFSLFGGDTLDNEDAVISIDGVPVVIATGYHGTMSIEIPQIDGTTATAEVVVEQVNMGTGGRYLNAGDSKALVQIKVQDPAETLNLSVYSNNSHGRNGDEFWAIDDVDISAR